MKTIVIFLLSILSLLVVSSPVQAANFAYNPATGNLKGFKYVAVQPQSQVKTAKDCQKGSLFGLPTWYKYLTFDQNCSPQVSEPQSSLQKNIYLIMLAIIELLLILSGMVAVIFVINGGVKFATSQGSPERISNAKSTIANAVIGLLIAVFASRIVAFIASRLS